VATPVFYSPDLDYWVVTRYHDIGQIFQTPKRFSAANTLAPLQPICPAAGHLLTEGGFRPVLTLTNSDPLGHSRVRRLATIAVGHLTTTGSDLLGPMRWSTAICRYETRVPEGN
jgi:cytochrome P450